MDGSFLEVHPSNRKIADRNDIKIQIRVILFLLIQNKQRHTSQTNYNREIS